MTLLSTNTINIPLFNETGYLGGPCSAVNTASTVEANTPRLTLVDLNINALTDAEVFWRKTEVHGSWNIQNNTILRFWPHTNGSQAS